MRIETAVFAFFLACQFQAFSDTVKRKGLAAHEHGKAKIGIAVEGNRAMIDFEAPAEGVIGFEREPRTPAQKAQQQAGLQAMRNRIGEIVRFDPSLQCRYQPQSVEAKREPGEDHAEVRAEFTVECARDLRGTRVQFGVSRVFPRIRTVFAQVLSGTQQSAAEIRNDLPPITIQR